jgi:hypothetical protein
MLPPMWEEIAEKGSAGDAQLFRPRPFAGDGIDAYPYSDGIERHTDISIIFERFHPGGAKRRLCEGMKREKHPVCGMLMEIKGLIFFVF